jgi:hypothetical protein
MQNFTVRCRSTMLAAVTLIAASAAQAAVVNEPITVNSGWHPFYFGDVGSPWLDFASPSDSVNFTFTLAGPATLNVTDAFMSGDQFNVVISNGFGGNTSPPVLAVCTGPGACSQGSFTFDFDAAFADPNFSHGQYSLGPGTYGVTGTVILSPIANFGISQAAVELTATPLPPSWTMLLIGLAGVGFAASRRSKGSRPQPAAA